MQNTQQAIATLQAYVNSQQPMLDIIKQTIEVLDANYQEALLAGDLKTTNDAVLAKEATISEMKSTLATKEALIVELNNQINLKTDSSPAETNIITEEPVN